MRIQLTTRRRSACRGAALISAGCMAWAGLLAQTNAAAANAAPQSESKQTAAPETRTLLPQFEVASIKAHKSEGMMMRAGMRQTPDGVSISGVPLSMLVSGALGLPSNQILNEPQWADSDRYDIEAKVDAADVPKLEKLTREQRMAMLLPLLEDRFGLKFHHETKVMEVYALVVDKGGPKLQPVKLDETSGGAMPPAPGNGNTALGRPDEGGPAKPPPGAMMMQMSPQGMTLRGVGITTGQLADMIERALGSTVVDNTGLTGKYDYTLTFAPEIGRGLMGGMPPPPPSGGSPSGEADTPTQAAPSIFTAVREQLGLKLQAKKEPVDVIVIDQVRQPSPN